MKDKQLACIILVLAIVGVGYGMQKYRAKLVTIQQEARQAQSDAESAEAKRNNAEKSLKVLQDRTAGLRDYFDQWLPHLGSAGSVEREEQKIINLIKRGAVFASAQRTEVAAANDQNDAFIPKKLRAHLTIEDDYTKAMNWVGSLEQVFPSCRVAIFKMTKGVSRNDVRLDMTIDFPLIASGKG